MYWNQDDELNLPTFIDIIGFDPQLSDPSKEDTVNSKLMNLIINGCLPENCDLLDLSKKLKDGQELVEKEDPENKSLAVDAIIVVISAQCSNLSQNVFSEIYKEANTKTKSKVHVSFAFNLKVS